MILRLREILESKRQMRRHLAALPISEKLRILDELRERTLAIRRSRKSRAADSGQGRRPA
jgi:hypothetical protein